MNLMFNSIKTWASKPFSSQMDVAHWVLFVGLLIIAVILWRMVLAHIPMGE